MRYSAFPMRGWATAHPGQQGDRAHRPVDVNPSAEHRDRKYQHVARQRDAKPSIAHVPTARRRLYRGSASAAAGLMQEGERVLPPGVGLRGTQTPKVHPLKPDLESNPMGRPC
jgi:hypothetical protein